MSQRQQFWCGVYRDAMSRRYSSARSGASVAMLTAGLHPPEPPLPADVADHAVRQFDKRFTNHSRDLGNGWTGWESPEMPCGPGDEVDVHPRPEHIDTIGVVFDNPLAKDVFWDAVDQFKVVSKASGVQS